MNRWIPLVLLPAALIAACAAPEPPAPPNIILIIGDDHGWPHFGFTTSSHCRPSLRSLLTGLHPEQWHARRELCDGALRAPLWDGPAFGLGGEGRREVKRSPVQFLIMTAETQAHVRHQRRRRRASHKQRPSPPRPKAAHTKRLAETSATRPRIADGRR